MNKAFIFLIILLSACSRSPIYQSPDIEMPSSWQHEDCLEMTFEPAPEFNWWEALDDPLLNELMILGEEQNLDLKIAAIRVLQARLEVKGKAGDLYPRLDGSFTSGHVSYDKKALSDIISKHCLKKDSFSFYEIGFDASWELDIFGMTAYQIHALNAKKEGLEDHLAFVWVTLSTEIAKNYILLRGNQIRLRLLDAQIESEKQQNSLLQQLASRGLINEGTVLEKKTNLALQQTKVPEIQLSISSAMHRLSTLLGYHPQELCEYLCCESPLPRLPSCPPIGAPSELLERRPDVRKAEKDLASATEQTESAIRALFPRFSLFGFIGDISTRAGSLFNSSSGALAFGPQILIPLFNSKLLLSDIEYNKLSTQEALYQYQQTVLNALEEAENAIGAYREGEQKLISLQLVHQLSSEASSKENLLYLKGVNNYISALESNKRLFEAHDALILGEMEQILHYIAVYKALGGNWE